MTRLALACLRGGIVAAGMLVTLAPSMHACAAASERRVVVAIEEKPDPDIGAGGTPRGYSGLQDYSGSDRARRGAEAVARDHGLHEVSAWTVQALHLRCMLYELPANADRDDALARLRQDKRVRIAQPLQEFRTYATPRQDAPAAPPAGTAGPYNDPYVGLQHGFSTIGAAAAQRWSNGARVEIAVVDTGIDDAHPDLAGQVVAQRDFTASAATIAAARDRHGTEVAGVIAAVANNGLGIVGVAPDATLRGFRACWPLEAGAADARCDTFTLAQAIGAAIGAKVRVINLSLGGPADPLLERLLAVAIERGIVVVGALPPDARRDGFPVNVPGVIAVRSDDMPVDAATLAAPGTDILTLEPGGHYDYASGTSLATAHVTGAIALLLALEPRLDAARAFSLLRDSSRGPSIDACAAIRALAGRGHGCDATATGLAHADR